MNLSIPDGAVAVIFSSTLDYAAGLGYETQAAEMERLATQQPGFLGIISTRDPDTNFGITVSYWVDDEAALDFKSVSEHRQAQRDGRTKWYSEYQVLVAQVQRSYQHPVE